MLTNENMKELVSIAKKLEIRHYKLSKEELIDSIIKHRDEDRVFLTIQELKSKKKTRPMKVLMSAEEEDLNMIVEVTDPTVQRMIRSLCDRGILSHLDGDYRDFRLSWLIGAMIGNTSRITDRDRREKIFKEEDEKTKDYDYTIYGDGFFIDDEYDMFSPREYLEDINYVLEQAKILGNEGGYIEPKKFASFMYKNKDEDLQPYSIIELETLCNTVKWNRYEKLYGKK